MGGFYMNYCEIGQKIRKYRKAKGLSQEQLAELVDISVTHLSHIETGNTKLSLQVFVDLAKALEVQTDDLLYEQKLGKSKAISELSETLDSCSSQQVRIIVDTVKALKISLDRHNVVD